MTRASNRSSRSRVGAGEQVVGVGVQPREFLVGVAGPGRRERLGEIVLLGEQIGGTVAHAPRLDEDRLRTVREDVGEQRVLVDEPRHPRLHALEVGALGEPFPLLAAPRLGTDEPCRPFPDIVGRHQLAGGEDQRLVEIGDRALVVDAERRQPVDLVTPQVDADRSVGRRRVHVDDRAAAGELATMFDQFLAAVPELDELGAELVRVDDRVRSDRDRFDIGRPGAELLEQCPHAGDDDLRTPFAAEPPQHLEARSHRLDGGADPFERERLPRREVGHVLRADVLAEIVVQLTGHRPGRARDDERTVVRQVSQRSDRDRACDLDDREPGVRVGERPGQTRLVAQAGRQFDEWREGHPPIEPCEPPRRAHVTAARSSPG